ncbi:hypothetical protein CGLO_15816 [Colletotrichum gloeosporioides Cg-14]|uniref:Uncharacterized protein n=1 Tax=Colletotrichum gloeosporioides (strain Cg-14) TaxID=1237896 RepID=T0JXW3_COLGC|nr:hypothetical protein CGLO_15816 [Colletotrichum gloeosporioides Cg-14]
MEASGPPRLAEQRRRLNGGGDFNGRRAQIEYSRRLEEDG